MPSGTKFLVCPNCGKRGVRYRTRRKGVSDHYGCRYCGFYVGVVRPEELDRENLAWLQSVNPEEKV